MYIVKNGCRVEIVTIQEKILGNVIQGLAAINILLFLFLPCH